VIGIDSGIAIFPSDTAWIRVGRRTALALVQPDSVVTVYPAGGAAPDETGAAMLVRVRPARPVAAAQMSTISWLLPASHSAGATVVAIRDSVAPDSSSRTWMIDAVRLRLRKTGRTTAELWAERDGAAPVRIRRVTIDPKADADMGVETDSVLTLNNWRMPVVVRAFRFGVSGPLAVVFEESGYECSNYRLIVFRDGHITPIDEPHYFQCQR
jgi:hypothetical protein